MHSLALEHRKLRAKGAGANELHQRRKGYKTQLTYVSSRDTACYLCALIENERRLRRTEKQQKIILFNECNIKAWNQPEISLQEAVVRS